MVVTGLGQVWERFDGKGMSAGIGGEELPLATRIMHAACIAETQLREAGTEDACDVLKRRRGGHLDPRVVDAFIGVADEAAAALPPIGEVWDQALAPEPAGPRRVDAALVEQMAEVFADFADLKSRFTAGHSRRTADLAAHAVGDAEAYDVRMMGWLHDLGRVSVPTGVWDKCPPLNPVDRARVHAHPAVTERILSHTALGEVGRMAAAHHERPDGRGYHRGIPSRQLPFAARVVAVASTWAELTADRAYRSALSLAQAADELRAAVRDGGLDREATTATTPAGLTGRKVEVLRLMVTGRPVKQVARTLGISGGDEPHFGKVLDVAMLALTGGRERTIDEYRDLFTASGFALSRINPTTGPLSAIEAISN